MSTRPRFAIALLSASLLSPGGGAIAGAASTGGAGIEHSIPARLAPRSLLLDGVTAGGKTVVVGERGHVLVSTDRGETWRQAEVESRALLTGVWMHDDRLGWAVGHDETILRTRDGGESWQRVHYAPDEERPLLDVWFADAEHGFAVGAYGAFLETADGGESWSERPISEDDFHLNQIAAAADGALYLAAEAGNLYRSNDRGESWTALPSPYAGSFFGILPLADGGLLAFGLRGHLFRSDDRGASWTAIETGTVASLTGGVDLRDGRVVVVGLAGNVLTSRDGGRSFRLAELADRRAAAAAVAAGDRVLRLGEGGAHPLEIAP